MANKFDCDEVNTPKNVSIRRYDTEPDGDYPEFDLLSISKLCAGSVTYVAANKEEIDKFEKVVKQ